MRKPMQRNSIIFLATLLCIVVLPLSVNAGQCSDGQTFTCPNCGGIEVTNCLTECDGFLNTDVEHTMCFRRTLFNNHDSSDNPYQHYHFLWNDIVGTIVWFLAAGIATACGVGGGGIYVPLGIVLLRFAPKPASGLSQASIFGASLGGLLLNIRNRHPNTKIKNIPGECDTNGKPILPPPDDDDDDDEEEDATGTNLKYSIHSGKKYYTRPLIDYDMALFLAPMEMAGAVMGTLIQKVMPNWLYLLIASVILSFTSYKTYKKFFVSYKKEKVEREKNKELELQRSQRRSQREASRKDSALQAAEDGSRTPNKEEGEGENGESFLENGKEKEEIVTTNDDSQNEKTNTRGSLVEEKFTDEDKQKEKQLRQQYLEEDSRQYPRDKLIAFMILWVGLLLITFLKGGKGVDSLVGITCESPWFGVLIAMQFFWTIGFAGIYGHKLIKKQALKDAVHYPYQPHDVIWNRQKLRFYAAFTFVAGIVAGLIGIGGGMVLGPLMLVMGIHPRVSTATTATMIVLTSSSVAIMFVTSGLVPWSYAVFFFFVCLSGAFIGKKFIDGYVKKTGMASILIFILATIIGLATLGCLVIVFTSLAKNNWCFEGFNEFCYVSSGADSCVAKRMMRLVDEIFA
uniref:Membrane transporter protein n=1 Tax=Attheya septentrionalis TaxID=420275 RepID=A0A7S2UHA8_9STRA|mmetsp:Transcript_2534/g.4603  ORF Transcript_2534/g.4603 Transcript_2534/m.4603 type:complete len:627 (+) Transcript_2534:110-1990(+)